MFPVAITSNRFGLATRASASANSAIARSFDRLPSRIVEIWIRVMTAFVEERDETQRELRVDQKLHATPSRAR